MSLLDQKEIQELNLSYNLLENLPQNLIYLPQLKTLLIEENPWGEAFINNTLPTFQRVKNEQGIFLKLR